MSSSARWLTPSAMLSAVFMIDGILRVGFGAASLVTPRSTFGTIVNLTDVKDGSLVLATLSSLSALYVLIGLVCVLAMFMSSPHKSRLAMLMAAFHGWGALKGYQTITQEWLVGSPWPDIVIHSVFVCAYALLVLSMWTQRPVRSDIEHG